MLLSFDVVERIIVVVVLSVSNVGIVVVGDGVVFIEVVFAFVATVVNDVVVVVVVVVLYLNYSSVWIH